MSPIATKPGGTFCDIGIRNVNQDGDETLEVWIRPYVGSAAVSGALVEPEPGVFVGATDFSEYDATAPGTVPDGLTLIGSTGNVAQITDDDVDEGKVFYHGGDDGWFLVFDAWVEVFQYGEILVRQRMEGGNAINYCGPANLVSDLLSYGDGIFVDTWWNNGAHTAVAERIGPYNSGDVISGDVAFPQYQWLRLRLTDAGGGNTRVQLHRTLGETAKDEPPAVPGVWDYDSVDVVTPQAAAGSALGWVRHGHGPAQPANRRLSYFSFSTDPTVQTAPGTVSEASSIEPGEWYLARSVPVAAGEDQVVRVEDLDSGTLHDTALRYRRGTRYNPGAEDTDDPTSWPSVSQGQFTTTVDPPTFVSAVWARTAVDAEEIVLTVTPDNPDDAIAVYREKEGDGAPTLVGQIAGPHGATAEFTDSSIEGEKVYFYSFATVGSAGPGAQSDQERIWSGPPAIPVFRFYTAEGGGYGVAFEDPADDTQGLELHDNYDNVGGTSPAFALRSEVDPIGVLTEIFSGVLSNIPAPELTFQGKIRFTQTASGTEDYGEFSPEFNVTVPESGGV